MTANLDTSKSILSTAEKKALLAERLQRRKQKSEAHRAVTIPRRPDSAPAPLTYTQEGVWYLEQLQPDTATYNMSYAWRLRGPLDDTALKQSLNTIVQRHESLRTHFAMIDGQPMQVITPNLSLALPIVDLQNMAEPKREARATALVAEEAYIPFDLTQAPLLRANLLRLAPEDYILTLTMHHIIGDGWSFNLLQNELAALYNALATKHPQPNLPELPVQYADFALWQRQRLTESEADAHLSYWRQQLNGAPPVLELPTDYARPSTQNYEGGRVSKILSPALSQALKTLSQQENVTLFMTLLAAFKVLLQR
jgi:non-ribosomal peptide synthetase component F